MNILVSALGAQPEIIEETVGFFNYQTTDFYLKSPALPQIKEARLKVQAVDELWLVATDQPHQGKYNSTLENFALIKKACAPYGAKIRLFLLQGVPDIKSNEDAEAFHDLALQVVVFARAQCAGGKLYLSLACGRKTMSADMQDAAYSFGCNMLLHVLGDRKEEALPVLLGPVAANPALRIGKTRDFSDEEIVRCAPLPQPAFLHDLRQQKESSQHFFTTYYLDEQETRANFHILYTLPPDRIQRLRQERIGVDRTRQKQELAWLRQLPKADLHCHLGGVLAPEDMLAVARCYEDELRREAQANINFARWRAALKPPQNPPENWKAWREQRANELRVPANLIVPALLLAYPNADALSAGIFGPYQEERAFRCLDADPEKSLKKYESLGDLQGSALLCQEKALRETLRRFVHRCKQENVLYLELRCSPLNYQTKTFQDDAVMTAILEELAAADPDLASSVLLIATRRKDTKKVRENIRNSVALVKKLQGSPLFDRYFRGFDLAGDESVQEYEEIRQEFLEIMQNCLNITIHAGEIMKAESVWKAVYHLNAERVGHGLTLREREDLMDKFLERGIGIEMCPSSNDQIAGFQDNYFPAQKFPEYPLKQYLQKELKVSINTDDPGISRTNATRELHKAARLTPGGLSKWEILQLICNSFRSAFYPYKARQELIRRVEKRLGELIHKDLL